SGRGGSRAVSGGYVCGGSDTVGGSPARRTVCGNSFGGRHAATSYGTSDNRDVSWQSIGGRVWLSPLLVCSAYYYSLRICWRAVLCRVCLPDTASDFACRWWSCGRVGHSFAGCAATRRYFTAGCGP